MSTVISVRVRTRVKEELEEAGIDAAQEIRRLLEDLAWRVRTRKQLEKWGTILARVKPGERGFSVESVREDRESH